MQNKLDNLTLDQFTKNLRELRDSGKWEQMSPVAQYNASVKFQKIYEHLSQKEQTQSRVEGLNAIKEEDEQLQELSQKYRQERNPVVNVLGDLIRGTVSLPTSTARISGLALDRLGAKSAGSALTRYAQNQEENAAIFLPPPDEGAGWGEKIFGAAAENAVPMVATGFGTGSLLSGAAKLGAGSKALKAIEIAGTSLGMSAPEIIKESTTFDEYGNPILPKSVLPIVAGSLLHGGIETGFGLSPVSLVTKGKGKFLTGLFAKDTLKRIAAFNKRYGPAKTAAIVAKRLFKDTPLGDSLGEGLEEVLQSPVTILTKNLANNDAETALNNSIQEMANLGYLKELGEEFVIGAGVGALYGGARTTIDKIDNAIESKQTSLEEKQELARRKEEILISEEEMNRAKEEEIRQNMAGQLSGNLAALKGREAEIMPESQTPWKPTTESDYRGSGISLQRKRNDTLIYPASSHVSAAQAVEKRVSPDQKPQLQDYANAVIRATMQGDESVIPLETAQQLLRDRNKIQDLEARINEDGGFGLKNGKPFPSIEIAKKFIDKSSFKADMVILPHSSGKGFIVAPDVAGEQFKQREMKNQAAAQMQREHIDGIKDIKTDSIGASKPTKDMSNRPQKVNSIKEVYEAATDQENKGRKVWHDISRVTAEEAAHLSAKTGLAIDENTVHMIDSDGVRHAFNEHGHESERQRGQIPITSEDLEKIADVLGNYDSVEKLQGLNKLGHEVIQYKKRINGHIFFLEEYRPSRNKLALATMWKKKAPSTQQHTSETSRPRKSLLESVEGASTSIIASPEEEVKLEKITEAPKKRKAPMRATRGTSALQGASQKAESSATSIIASTGQEVKSAETIEKVTQEKPNITLQTKSNITDVGSLDKETAGKIGRESAPIRVTSRLIPHLPKNRIEKIKEMGYSSVEHFVSDVLQNYRYIHKGKGESLLVSKDAPDRSLAFIELKKAPGDKFYEVESIMPKVRDNYLKNKEMLLDRAQTSQSFNETPPSAVSGRSISTSIIASTRQEVKSADALSDAELKNTTKIEKPAKDGKLYSVEYLVAKYAAQGLKQAAKVVRRGAALIHSGVKEFAKWARQLVSEFGQNVKKYLVGLYKDVTTAYNRQKLHRRRGAIDLRPVGKTRQQIIELPVNLPDGLKTDSISAIRSWLKENFQGKSIFNKSLNAEIEFVAKGIKETVIQLAHRKNKEGKIEAHKHSLPILDKLLEQAIYENSTDDKNKGLKKDFADKIHYLSTNVRFEGEDYHIKFVVKQYGAKNNYHTHMLSNIEIKKESYAQKDGLRDYLTASAPLSDSFTSSIPKTETEVKPSEIDEIKAQAKADGTWLKAPNGKASKLNERQWLQVRTKAFKDWFGDWQNDLANASKVVDENGEPLVVYHGGSVGNEFSKEYAGSGGGRESAFFFTPDIRQAKDYAGANKVKEVFINLRTPLYTDIQLEYDETKKAKANGKDGYWIIEDGLIDESEIAVFEPTQIKSATANVGTFSKSDPNILYSVEYLVAKYTAQGLKQAAKVVRRGAALIHSGVKEFAKWARQLFNEFGQNVKKYLRGLYKDVTTAYNRQKLHSRRGAVDFRDTRSPKEMVKDKWAKKGLEKAYLFGDKLYNAGKTTFAEWQKYMQQRFKDIKEGELRDLWQNVKNPEAILKPKSLRDNNVPVSDKVFDMLGIKPDRVFADYSYLHQQHSEYFKSPAEVKKVAEYVLANPEISTQEVDGNAGLIRVSDGKVVEPVDIGYQTFKHPKIKLELEKRSNGYHVRSVHLLSDEQMIRDNKRRNSAPLDAKVTPNKLTEGVTTNKTAVLQAQVDARTSSTTSIPETDSKVKPADKKARLARPSDFKWEKIDKDTYMLQFTDPDNGEMSTVAKLARNKTGKGSHRWVWVGTNRAFLDAVSAKSSVKDKMFQKIKNSKYEQRKAARIAEREKLKQDKKKQEAQAYIDEGKKKAVEEELPKTYKDKVKHFIERAEEVLFDIWAPVKRLQKKIVEGLGKELPDDLNLYEKLELISGKIEEHVKKAKLEYLDKIKAILIKYGIDVKDFDRFLYVSHAPERNDAVAELKNSPFALTGAPGSGISTEQANEELKKFEALPNYEGYKKAAELYYQLTNFLLDEQVRLGILSQKQRDAYRRKYKKYTPLKSPPDQGFILERKAFGRRSEASEQLAFTEQAIHAVYSRAFKKELASTAIKLFQKFPDSKMYERVKPKKVQILDKKGRIHIRQQMDKFFGNPEMIWAQDTETGDYSVYRIKDESLKRALITTFKEDTVEKGFFRAFAKINRWLAATATAWNPEFIYTNLVRDVQLGAANVGINLPEGSVKEFMSNLARSKQAISDLKNGKVTEDTKLLNEFKLAGGKTGYSEFARLEDRASKLNKEVSDAIEGGNLYKIKQNMKSVKEFIETWNDAIETRTRFAGYLTAKEAGFSTQKAAAFAKNMTVNFNKKGSWAPVLNSLYLFSTANLGGTLVTVNLVKKAWGTKKGKAMIAAAITLGFLSEVLNSLVAGDDDEDGVNYYAKVPDYIKDANYVFMVPGGKGKYVAIPMPYGLNVLPSIGRNIAASMLGNQKASKGAVNIAGSLFDAFNPLGGDRRSLPYQVVPTAVRPLLDVATNTTWTGRKIRPEQDVFGSKVANAELYYEQNSKIIRNISKFFNEISGGNRYTSGFLDFPLTPGEIEHLLQSATGGIGKTIKRVSDLVVKDKEELSLDSVPVLRRFVNSSNDYTTYEAFRANTEAVRDFERAKRERDVEWLKNNRWLMAAAEKFKQTQKITTAVNKSKLPEIKKRERILKEQKNFNKYFDKLKSKVLSKY